MSGFAITRQDGDERTINDLAELLEEAADRADDLDLWYNGSPASSQYREMARYLGKMEKVEKVEPKKE